MDAAKGSFCYPLMQERVISAIHGCSKGKFLRSMDAAKGSFCYPLMQERVISAIHGCSKGKFLLSIDAGKVISAINGCSKGMFLLSVDAAKGSLCYPWMQEREVSAIHGCSKGKFLLSIDAGKGNAYSELGALFCWYFFMSYEKFVNFLYSYIVCRNKELLLL